MRNFKKELEKDISLEKKILRQDLMRLHNTDEEYLTYSNGRFYRNYYLNGKRISKYISTSDKRTLSYLLRRGIYKKRIRILQSNLKFEEKLLKYYLPYDQLSIVENMSEAYKIGFGLFSDEEEKQTAEKYSIYAPQEDRWHITIRGDRRRSKSEVIISNILDEYRVKYEYEKPLYWNDDVSWQAQNIAWQAKLPQKVLPDFTIELPDGQTLYWEHLGLLTEEEYRRNWADKHLFYFLQGINLGEQLIVTCDSVDGNFDSGTAARIAEKLAKLQLRSGSQQGV